MEIRGRHSSHALLLNVFACIAAVAVAIGIVGYSYFQFRARQEEAKQMEGVAEIIGGTMKMQKDYWNEMDKAQQRMNQPAPATNAPPTGEPPAPIRAEATPQTTWPFSNSQQTTPQEVSRP